jgi:hypothetical protein
LGLKIVFLKSIQKIKNFELKEQIFKVISNVENAINLNDIHNLKKLKGYIFYFRIRKVIIEWVLNG